MRACSVKLYNNESLSSYFQFLISLGFHRSYFLISKLQLMKNVVKMAAQDRTLLSCMVETTIEKNDIQKLCCRSLLDLAQWTENLLDWGHPENVVFPNKKPSVNHL